jgi:hypothetical protein
MPACLRYEERLLSEIARVIVIATQAERKTKCRFVVFLNELFEIVRHRLRRNRKG